MSQSEKDLKLQALDDPEALARSTNIDRRNCSRVVPMEVLALGLSRSGTSSLRHALVELGYKDTYHMASVLNENPLDARMWLEAFKAKYDGVGHPFTKSDWDQLLGHCMAVTDTPCVMFYKELLEAYPDAKVILTMRDSAEQWWESHMHTLIPLSQRFYIPPKKWSDWLYYKFTPAFLPSTDPRQEMYVALAKKYEMFQVLVEDWQQGTKKGIQWYEDYCAEIQRIVPKENLLVFNNKQGWDPLCQFLGKAKPEKDFPRVNSTKEFNDTFGALYDAADAQAQHNVRRAVTVGSIVIAAVTVGVALWQRKTL